MTDPEEVFAMFVAADPVADEQTNDQMPPPLDPSAEVLPFPGPRELRSPRETGQRLAWVASAAACLLILMAAGLWMTQRPSIETGPADDEGAIEAPSGPVLQVLRWQNAINSGDVTTALALSVPDSRTTAERRLYGWLAGMAASGTPITLSDCEDIPATATTGEVLCVARTENPVMVELDMAEFTAPFDYENDLLTWRPYQDGDITAVNAAYADYLSQFKPEQFAEACTSIAYEPGTIVLSERLALTGECAQVAAPLSDEIAQWIRDGRPGT